jgi:hypothetical protein
VQFGDHGRIPTTRLDPLAGLHGNQRGRHHDALMTQSRELPVQAIAAWTCLVTKVQSLTGRTQTLDQLADMIGAIRDRAETANLTPRAPSAIATEIAALWTSKPTKMVLFIRSVPHV